MRNSKKIIENQFYENYWSLTLEYSDINSHKFNNTLNLIVKFIDDGGDSNSYRELQEIINSVFPKSDMASVRKSINQFIKLGFINPLLTGYHPKTKKFINEQNNEKKRNLFSEILYSAASFNSSVSQLSHEKEINFFIKTLEKNNKLTDEEIIGLMLTTPSNYPKGYLDNNEVKEMASYADAIKFKERKYNQLRYIIGIFKQLKDVNYISNYFTLENISDVEDDAVTKTRDNYLQRLYKDALKLESVQIFQDKICMLSKVPYYAMIASHIKPFAHSNDNEEYDSQNGLLLGKDLDYLFDKGYISINFENGKVITSSDLKKEIIQYHKLDNLYLDDRLLTPERSQYLYYHNKNIFRN